MNYRNDFMEQIFIHMELLKKKNITNGTTVRVLPKFKNKPNMENIGFDCFIDPKKSAFDICEENYHRYIECLQHNENVEINEVKFIKMQDDAIVPSYKTAGAVGMDICAYLPKGPINIYQNQQHIIDTGIKIQLPNHLECQVRSRSGLASQGVIVLNAPGTIDPDYTGEIKVILTYIYPFEHIPFTINHGDRIAQLVFSPITRVSLYEVQRFTETERGEGGFGSTGV